MNLSLSSSSRNAAAMSLALTARGTLGGGRTASVCLRPRFRHFSLYKPLPPSSSLLSSHRSPAIAPALSCYRHLSSTTTRNKDGAESGSGGESKEQRKQQRKEFDERLVAEQPSRQARAPWHRQGASMPPVRRPRSAGAMTKGKLLTTPSRLLKLIIPLTTADYNSDRKDVQPLALLVHPQQPLSYLERLIQAELPAVRGSDGRDSVPAVHFKAEDFGQDEIVPGKAKDGEDVKSADQGDGSIGKQAQQRRNEEEDENAVSQEEGDDEMHVDGKVVHTGKIVAGADGKEKTVEPQKAGAGSANSSGSSNGQQQSQPAKKKKEADEPPPPGHQHKLVRWSSSTEIGDFIRDAARGKEFAVEIEGSGREIMIGVPSFADRTQYLRARLRKLSREIASMASVKDECDAAARRSAQHVALGGFGALVGWWVGVYYLTFKTSLGWDVMEPVTYLVGLSTLMGGYLWFLYHNREVSYRSALNLTVSRRQSALYERRGFDLARWESLVHDANALRREVKRVADEYDVDWDERQDEHDRRVVRALKRERDSHKRKSSTKDDDDDDDDGSDGSNDTEPAEEDEAEAREKHDADKVADTKAR